MIFDLPHIDPELENLFRKFEETPNDEGLRTKICYELNIRSYHEVCVAVAQATLSAYDNDMAYEWILAASLDEMDMLHKAKSWLENKVSKNPNPGALRNLALIHFIFEEDQEAQDLLEDLQKSKKGKPMDSRAHEVMTQIYMAREQYAEAIAEADLAVLSGGPFARTVRLKGLCHWALEEHDKALFCLKQSLELEPNFVWACHTLAEIHLEKDDWSNGFKFFARATSINPRDAGNYFLLAEAFMDAERYDLAYAELEKLRWLSPSQRILAELENAEGFICIQQGDPQAAIKHLNQAIDLVPDLAVAYYNLGLAAYLDNKRGLAEKHFKKSVQMDESHVEAWVELGMICLETDRLNKSKQHFLTALAINPDSSQAYLGLSLLSQKKKLQEACLEYAELAMETDPLNPDIANQLAIAYEINGQRDLAARCYEQALALDPLHAKAANNLGYLYEKNMELDPPQKEQWRERAIMAWSQRLQICTLLKTSVRGAQNHLKKLGLSAKDIKSIAQTAHDA